MHIEGGNNRTRHFADQRCIKNIRTFGLAPECGSAEPTHYQIGYYGQRNRAKNKGCSRNPEDCYCLWCIPIAFQFHDQLYKLGIQSNRAFQFDEPAPDQGPENHVQLLQQPV